jgi:hypothetical protein
VVSGSVDRGHSSTHSMAERNPDWSKYSNDSIMNALKKYLQLLTEPLLTYDLFQSFTAATGRDPDAL